MLGLTAIPQPPAIKGWITTTRHEWESNPQIIAFPPPAAVLFLVSLSFSVRVASSPGDNRNGLLLVPTQGNVELNDIKRGMGNFIVTHSSIQEGRLVWLDDNIILSLLLLPQRVSCDKWIFTVSLGDIHTGTETEGEYGIELLAEQEKDGETNFWWRKTGENDNWNNYIGRQLETLPLRVQ